LVNVPLTGHARLVILKPAWQLAGSDGAGVVTVRGDCPAVILEGAHVVGQPPLAVVRVCQWCCGQRPTTLVAFRLVQPPPLPVVGAVGNVPLLHARLVIVNTPAAQLAGARGGVGPRLGEIARCDTGRSPLVGQPPSPWSRCQWCCWVSVPTTLWRQVRQPKPLPLKLAP